MIHLAGHFRATGLVLPAGHHAPAARKAEAFVDELTFDTESFRPKEACFQKAAMSRGRRRILRRVLRAPSFAATLFGIKTVFPCAAESVVSRLRY